MPQGTRLACSVRGCGRPLERAAGALVCAGGHAFDVARSGYANLLQPQDRRSLAAGDDRATVDARRRLADSGFDRSLVEAVRAWFEGVRSSRVPAVLDVGCGIGTALASVAERCEPYGVDLSRHAVDAAARRVPGATFVAANADRRLPFGDGSLDVLISIKGPKNPAEFARVLAPDGALLVVVPGTDDLAELRRATSGASLAKDPAERTRAQFEALFELCERREVREQTTLSPEALRDVLRTAYRGARKREALAAAELGPLSVTASAVLLSFARRANASAR